MDVTAALCFASARELAEQIRTQEDLGARSDGGISRPRSIG